MHDELIVFVDENGKPTGETGPKLASHNSATRRHLAFSCFVFKKSDNTVLLTRRAESKKVWPGVWTGSVCGHPMPGEAMEDAIRRRAAYELGLTDLHDITVKLPDFSYVTPPFKGVIENEFCPVYFAVTDEEPRLNSDEVVEMRWLAWDDFVAFLKSTPNSSDWVRKQLALLG
jgi:isopentenyl-diphosphate delta-isomerase